MSVKLTEIIFLPWDLLVVENRTLEQLSRSQTTLGSMGTRLRAECRKAGRGWKWS